jgi:hypothetical protein
MGWGMFRNLDLIRSARCRSSAAALSLALLAAGCSGGSGLGSLGGSSTASAPPPAGSQPAASPSFSDKVSGFFGGASAKDPQQVAGANVAEDCPLIDIRQGASTLKVGTSGTVASGDSDDNGAMALKYQGTFVRAARECALVAGQLVMKVGVEGRIIVGPAGGPGQIVVPLRIAVVQETTKGTQPIVTKFIQIPVTITSATDNPTFTHVEEGLSFPMPRNLDDYVVYIGFDPLTLQGQQHPAAKPKPKAKRPAGT